MKKVIALLTAIMLLLSACSSATLDGAGKELEDTIANATDADNKYVQMVKGGYRTDDPSVTYETAFSSFFGTPRWKYFKGDNDQDVVEFTGDCIYRDVSVKARIQFIVDEENGTFEATYLAFNEVPQDALTLATVISKAFEEAKAAGNGGGSTDTVNQVLISGIPVRDVFGLTADGIIATFGEPDTRSSNFIQYKIRDDVESTFYDDGWMSFSIAAEGRVESCSTDPANLTFNNQNLNQDSDAVIAILGDNYAVTETTGYSWIAAWDYGDYHVSFEFPRNTDDSAGQAGAFAVEFHKGQGTSDGNGAFPPNYDVSEGDYSWGGGDTGYSAIDPSLVGRWRAYDGSALTLEDTGYATTYFKFWYGLNPDPEYVTWEAYDNRLILSAHCSHEYQWWLSSSVRIVDDLEIDELHLGSSGKYWREKIGGNDLVGTWTSSEKWDSGFTLHPDGTGMKGSLPITWWIDGDIFHYNTTETHSYDYTISGDTLTVFFSDGSRIYTRVGN